MAETKTETTQKAGADEVTKRTVIEERQPRVAEKVKTFRLKLGAKHFANGSFQTGGEVELTEDQARAFRDKIEAVDDSDFTERDQTAQKRMAAGGKSDAAAKNRDERLDQPDDEENATQGPAVPQAPVVVGPGAGPRDPSSAPADPSVLDPARQGQQSREMRAFIDSGQMPAPEPVEKTVEVARDIAKESGVGLRSDGPTLDEWKASGKKESDYPPAGYADRRGGNVASESRSSVKGGGAGSGTITKGSSDKLK